MKDMRGRTGIFLLLATAACAGSSTSSGTSQPAPDAASESAGAAAGIPVVIDNQNITDLNIYLVKGGGRVLVGRAPTGKKSTIVIPESVTPASSRITLVADPPGGSGPITTAPTFVPPGQRLYWRIGSDQTTSTSSTGE
jgi:hypothetical protein